ncbi:related to acetylornithine aminotransferase [Rhynchosporium graminicola]|uniref:Related to acetylornithine aminotransferase n=1 Tax=Rhynchosporium graminicola TaxID=2792576 RepID=A0A1E1L8U4_9HELO|nr:related to acetylornithine aminotransferase [Rhynchosporium commune]
MPPQTSSLWRSLRAYQIYGANTDVGKTIMSTILCKAFAKKFPAEKTWYLKPVSTGPVDEADDRHLTRFSPETKTSCLFQFDEAPPSDSEVQEQVLSHLASCAQSEAGTILVETAGGVHSPTPSGSSQADLFRPLRLPVCLVADYRLGGISASISAFESLHIRGYDLNLILQFEESKYQNHNYLKTFFEKKGILELSLPLPPARGQTLEEDVEIMTEYYDKTSKLDQVDETIFRLAKKHTSRINNLEGMSTRAHTQIWYPFTQHRDVSPESITAIDSAVGDFFQTHSTASTSSSQGNILAPTFDGSASWWTQGLGHGNPDLSLAASYAAGRYGHVMFAGMINEPALLLAENLLRNLNNPRMSRVFYSDNGSTGMEVATKMALTASYERYKWDVPKENVGVIGLKGSYHGDTIGAMDCSEPSTFNEKVHWYRGRGYWFDFPQVKLVNGKWIVDMTEGMESELGKRDEFASLADIFDIQARHDSVAGKKYRAYIEETLERLVKVEGMTFGALIMEPVILGAGGMLFADPLFQHCLVRVIRNSSHIFNQSGSPTPKDSLPDPKAWSGLPIIFDEVFTGLYRLGRFTSSSFIQTHADISVHAKLLTGGLVPLCTTVASESIYEAFLGEQKSDALLHGHSYTAHPVGCHVANTSLDMLRDLDAGGAWEGYRRDWAEGNVVLAKGRHEVPSNECGDVWSVWGKGFVKQISCSREVESVVALGSVLAISLQDKHAGYSSTAAIGLQKKLLTGSVEFKIHVRVLGNVLYMMASQMSKPETLRGIEKFLAEELC